MINGEKHFSLYNNYTEALERLDTDGKKLIGYFTNRVPVEIIHALGLHPIRIVSIGITKTGASEQYIQSFGCSWLRQIMDLALSGGFRTLDGIIFSTGTCDSLQNVSDLWRKVFPTQWTYNLTFPVLTSTNAARSYLQTEFENLIHSLYSKFVDSQHELKLVESIKLYNQKRVYFQKLASLVSLREILYFDLAKLLYLGDILPIEEVLTLLEEYLQSLKEIDSSKIPQSPRLLVTGGMGVDNFDIWKIQGFNYIVADDLSFGTRNFNFVVPTGKFLEGLTQTYMERIPDPTALDMHERMQYLKKLIRDNQIDGVILLNTKWCDPEAFEFVHLQNKLKEMEIPSIIIETTPDLSNREQIHTKLAAFLELLS